MKIFRKVTLKYLKRNKVRTFATIIGILLSAAMICAVATFLSSIDQYVVDNAIHNTGNWQVGTKNVDWQTCETLIQSEELTNVVYSQRVGYAPIEELENQYKSYYYIIGIQKDFMETMCAHITSGRFPREEGEILLPESILQAEGVEFSIGDGIILSTGVRSYRSVVLWQDDPYVFGDERDCESFSWDKTRLYKVVGFYDDLSYKIESASAPGYTVFTYFNDKPFIRDGGEYDVYFNVKNAADVYQISEKYGIEVTYNAEVLGVMGILGQEGTQMNTIVLVVFIIGMILLGSIALIYNMFSISVSERTKQFGLLSSIGATQKQMQKMVLYEAFVVSCVGIPFGILVGIGGIWVVLQFVGDKFQALGYSIPMTVQVSWVVIVISAVLSLVTVLVSAWIPSRRAMKMTVIETLKQNKDIYQSGKRTKNYDSVHKIFGLSGMLASQYCNRSQKKYKATLLSLCISSILFVLVSFFMDYALKMVEHTFDKNSYDLAFYYDEQELVGYSKDEFMELLKAEEHITDAVYTSSTKSYRVEMDKKYLSSWALENIGTMTSPYRFNPDIVATTINVTFVQDAVFKELLQKYDLNETDFMSVEHPKAIVVDGIVNANSNTTVNLLSGDECRVSFIRPIQGDRGDRWGEVQKGVVEKLYFTLEGGKTIYERPYYLEDNDGLVFLYPDSVRQYYADNNEELFPKRENDGEWVHIWYEDGNGTTIFQYAEKTNDYSRLVDDGICNCKFQSEDYDASYEAMRNIVVNNNLNVNNFMNNAERIEKENNLVLIIRVLSLGFLVLMTMVSAINVFNTISTNISLRRREFAVLKSIGMTEKGLNRMMLVECLLLSGKAMLYGIPISVVGTLLLYVAMSSGSEIAYHFPWMPIVVAVVGIFVILVVTMLYIMRTRKKENVIETLKNENV